MLDGRGYRLRWLRPWLSLTNKAEDDRKEEEEVEKRNSEGWRRGRAQPKKKQQASIRGFSLSALASFARTSQHVV